MRLRDVLRNIDWWVVLVTATLSALGIAFVHSATVGYGFEGVANKQALFVGVGAFCAVGIILVPYARFLRASWLLYALAILALLGLPLFGNVINGARRWYTIFGFGVQPSEFAKIAVILALASWLRFRDKARTVDGLFVPVLITALPVGLIFLQPDLGTSLVFWPILLATCYAAGTPAKSLAGLVTVGALLLGLAWFTVLHDYQRSRVEVWAEHFEWDPVSVETDPEVINMLRGDGYQPWQSLIAIGSGGWHGAGYMQGPQSRFDFLPYRAGDYVFSVVAEEVGFLGAGGVVLLNLGLALLILGIARRTRERFGRLVAVGVAAWLGTQSILHVAVCAWFVPSTGLPMPFVSHGGSSTIAAWIGVALAVNIGARKEPVLSSDGFS